MYYAVKKGKQAGIYQSWDEAKKQVIGYSGAIYKKFKSYEEASDFMKGESKKAEIHSEDKLKEGEIIAYVDGSYNIKDTSFSYGALLFDNSGIYEEHSERFFTGNNEMRNVAGEIKGAEYAMKRALELGKNKLYLHFDYSGIEHWARGEWKTNKEGTINYKNFYDSIRSKLKVEFIKVKAHSGVEYNEIVDKLAKEAE